MPRCGSTSAGLRSVLQPPRTAIAVPVLSALSSCARKERDGWQVPEGLTRCTPLAPIEGPCDAAAAVSALVQPDTVFSAQVHSTADLAARAFAKP